MPHTPRSLLMCIEELYVSRKTVTSLAAWLYCIVSKNTVMHQNGLGILVNTSLQVLHQTEGLTPSRCCG